MEVKKKIDLSYQFKFPPFEVIKYKHVLLVVIPSTGNWIVLDSDTHLQFFKLLQSVPLEKALVQFEGEYSVAQNVVTQVIARHLEDTQTTVKTKNLSLHLHLTNACNLRCPHCYMSSGTLTREELHTDEIRQLLTNFAHHGGQELVLTGGEIMVHKDLISIITWAHDLGLEIELLTNGVLWKEQDIQIVAPMVRSVQISVDGFDEAENSRVRGIGNFQKALDVVRIFLQHGVYTRIAVTPLLEHSYASKAPQYIEFIKKLQQQYGYERFSVTLSGIMLDGRDNTFSNEAKQHYLETSKSIFEQAFDYNEDDPFIKFHQELGIEDNCRYGHLVVNANGDVYTCPSMTHLTSFANIRRDSFDDIMRRAEIARKSSHIDSIAPCKDCAVRYICGGGCRIELYTKLCNGDTCEDGDVPRRKCTAKDKQLVYEQMLRTNEALFR